MNKYLNLMKLKKGFIFCKIFDVITAYSLNGTPAQKIDNKEKNVNYRIPNFNKNNLISKFFYKICI